MVGGDEAATGTVREAAEGAEIGGGEETLDGEIIAGGGETPGGVEILGGEASPGETPGGSETLFASCAKEDEITLVVIKKNNANLTLCISMYINQPQFNSLLQALE